MPNVAYPCDQECPPFQAMQDGWSEGGSDINDDHEELERFHRFSCERCLRYSVEHGEGE